ncbi:hypothetical protein WJX72_011456 [[Myrmecia] bisecta]|uniref:Aminotransferase class I/classII large domain-containing protein n=1 Tax=[Myrmecia] bisecta TaxID=41462 RepID=A0AAW1QGK3_9CHLO
MPNSRQTPLRKLQLRHAGIRHLTSTTEAKELEPFTLERYFAKYEFSTPYLLCCSDCEPMQLTSLLQMADQDSLNRWQQLRLAYTESAGLPALRIEISSLYRGIQPEHVVVLAPEEGVYLGMLALLKAGDHVIVTFPGYQSLYSVAQSLGCEVSFWEPVSNANGALRFDMEQLAGLIRNNTKAVVVNFPHNPSGALPTSQEWQHLIELCRANGAYLFSDEMYRLLELDPRTRLPSAADAYERGIALSGVSKTLGLPGLRIGWLASQDERVLMRVLELKDYTTICSSAPSEVLALIGLRAKDMIIARNLSTIRHNIKAAETFFGGRKDQFEFTAPLAGTVAFPRVTTGEPIDDFCKRCVEGAGVLLLPASVYTHAPSVEAGRFRLGLGRSDFTRCLRELGAYTDRAARSARRR